MSAIRTLIGAAGLHFIVAVGSAVAGPITFIHTGDAGSGTLNGVPFDPASFVFTSTADTNNRVDLGFGWFIDHDSSQVSIAGLGTFDVLSPTRTFVSNSGQLVGYSRGGMGGFDLYDGPSNVAFGSWDMTTGIGPISGSISLIQWGDEPVNTSGGVLFFNDSQTQGTFTAVIPAPLSLSLLGAGAIGVAIRRRR